MHPNKTQPTVYASLMWKGKLKARNIEELQILVVIAVFSLAIGWAWLKYWRCHKESSHMVADLCLMVNGTFLNSKNG